MERLILIGKPVISGKASGIALVSREPLSFWGGYDWKSGEITDRRHPLSGENARGKVLVVPFTRGSSTTTEVLLEAIREGTAPAAIGTTATDFFFALASVVVPWGVFLMLAMAPGRGSLVSGSRMVPQREKTWVVHTT